MIVSTRKRSLDPNRGSLSDYDSAIGNFLHSGGEFTKPTRTITTRLASVMNLGDFTSVLSLVHEAIANTAEYSTTVKDFEIEHVNTGEAIAQHIDEGLCVVAVVDGQIVGACFGEDEGGVIWLSWIVVTPEYQRRGIGKELLDKFIDVVRGEGVRAPLGHKIACSVLVSNQKSNQLFIKRSFRRDALLVNHWHNLDFNLWSLEL